MTFSCGTDLGLESRALNRQVSPSPDILQSQNNVRVEYQNHLSQDKNWWEKKSPGSKSPFDEMEGSGSLQLPISSSL